MIDTNLKGMIMKKFAFTVDVVGGDENATEILSAIQSAVQGHGEYRCVEHAETTDLTDQGLKVWVKRKVGISLAQPKKKASKAPKAPKAEVVEAATA